MSDNSKLIKFDVCVYKKDEVPEQEFVDWVTKEWPARATPLIKRHGVVKLAQVCNFLLSVCNSVDTSTFSFQHVSLSG